MTDLGTLGGSSSNANGINNIGQVVGTSSFAGDQIGHAFIYDHGNMTDLGTLGGRSSSAWGINDRGQVVGYSETLDGSTHAFLYSEGRMTDLGTSPFFNFFNLRINNNGDIAGTYNVNDTGRAFLYSAGQTTDLGTLGGAYDISAGGLAPHSTANGINDSGQIVGYSITDDVRFYHSFLSSNGAMTDIHDSSGGMVISRATDINNKGQIVGSGNISFLYDGGQAYDLNDLVDDPRRKILLPSGINDTGQIIASACATNNLFACSAVLLTPGDTITPAVPEPRAYMMLLAGLGIVGTMARWRKMK